MANNPGRRAASHPDIQRAAEAEIIGGLLVNRDIHLTAPQLHARHFTIPALREAWEKLLEDSSLDTSFSLQMAIPSLTPSDLAAINRATKKPVNYHRAVRYLQRTHERLEIERIIDAMAQRLSAGTDPAEVAAQAIRSLEKLGQHHLQSTPAHSVAQELVISQTNNRSAIPTGLQPLDYILHGGLHRGCMTAILARYKVGKTIMQATLAHNLSSAGYRTLLVSLERRQSDSEAFIMARCLGIDASDLANRLPPEFDPMIEDYLATQRPLWYIHRPGIAIDELRGILIATTRTHRLDAILIDHWQLIRSAPTRGQNREQEQAETAQGLADLAALLDIPIVLTGQLNDQGMPRGSEAVLASAGMAIRLNRPDNGPDAFLDTLVSNKGPVRIAGGPAHPSITLDPAGPHFRAL